jgi:hypothetical protein
LLQQPSLSLYPPFQLISLIKEKVMPTAPKGFSDIVFAQSASLANENAIKTAFLLYFSLHLQISY